jgi:hypothetical protein
MSWRGGLNGTGVPFALPNTTTQQAQSGRPAASSRSPINDPDVPGSNFGRASIRSVNRLPTTTRNIKTVMISKPTGVNNARRRSGPLATAYKISCGFFTSSVRLNTSRYSSERGGTIPAMMLAIS